jgi:hypothetical protein
MAESVIVTPLTQSNKTDFNSDIYDYTHMYTSQDSFRQLIVWLLLHSSSSDNIGREILQHHTFILLRNIKTFHS